MGKIKRIKHLFLIIIGSFCFLNNSPVFAQDQKRQGFESFMRENNGIYFGILTRLELLAVDYCHSGIVKIFFNVDSTGKLQEYKILSSTSNLHWDSIIYNSLSEFNGKWKMKSIDFDFPEIQYTSTFNPHNHHIKVSGSRDIHSYLGASSTMQTIINTRYVSDNWDKECQDNDFYYNKGLNEFKENNFNRAIYYFNMAKKSNEFDLDNLFNLGLSYIKNNSPKKGCPCFEKAMNMGDKNSGKAFNTYCLSGNK